MTATDLMTAHSRQYTPQSRQTWAPGFRRANRALSGSLDWPVGRENWRHKSDRLRINGAATAFELGHGRLIVRKPDKRAVNPD